MLYQRWLETSRRHAHQPAILGGDRAFTFADLASAVAATPVTRTPVIARSGGIDFIIAILQAWRDGQPVIPVERDALEPTFHSPLPAATCLVKYTPGASGIPRGIFLSAEQVMADGDRLAAAMDLAPNRPNLAVISLAHSYGFSNVALPLILHGVPFHFAAVPFPRVIQEIFQQHSSLVVPAVPSMWRAWHRAGILSGAPIAMALSAGAPLALALENDVFQSAGLKLRNFYGASECGGISLDTSDVPRTDATDVGTPLDGVTVSVQEDARLLVTSSSVAMAYDSSRAEDRLGGGSYLTRDLGFKSLGEKLHLTGTLGGAINVAGRKISPTKVEAALIATGLVRSANVFGVPSSDPERVAEIFARVELVPGNSLESLKSAACDQLQLWELPRRWEVAM